MISWIPAFSPAELHLSSNTAWNIKCLNLNYFTQQYQHRTAQTMNYVFICLWLKVHDEKNKYVFFFIFFLKSLLFNHMQFIYIALKFTRISIQFWNKLWRDMSHHGQPQIFKSLKWLILWYVCLCVIKRQKQKTSLKL